MNKPWRFFLIVESLIAILVLWQLIQNFPVLFLSAFGAALMFLGQKSKKTRKWSNGPFLLGFMIFCFSILNLPAVWFMLIFAVLFIGLKGLELSGLSLKKTKFHLKKEMVIVEGTDSIDHSGQIKKQTLFGNQRIGNHIYEWDNMNLLVASGDTIIDLGNTILPKGQNIIVIRKGIGRTRILVPSGIGIHLDCSIFAGKVIFKEEKIELWNERLSLYSKDYQQTTRKIKIISNTIVGDIEVIEV